MMRVFVAGAAGAVGVPLVRQLVALGHDVIGTTRSEGKRAALRDLGAEPVVLDGLDATAVGEAVAQAEPDVVIHQMTALTGASDLRHFDRTFATTNRLRTAGTDNLLAAARAAGVRRFIAQSFAGWPTVATGRVKTEDDPFRTEVPKQMRAALAAIEHLERAVLDAPLDGVVLRYGGLYGPGASDELVAAVRARKMPIIGAGSGIFSMLHVDDAAGACVAALTGPAGLYQIVDDDPTPLGELLPTLAEMCGAKPPRRVPVWLARLAAGESVLLLLNEPVGCSNAKAKGELGWTPRWPTWRDGFRAALTGGASAASEASA
jgi:nucleoside-diphosphate-sugar epimerase